MGSRGLTESETASLITELRKAGANDEAEYLAKLQSILEAGGTIEEAVDAGTWDNLSAEDKALLIMVDAANASGSQLRITKIKTNRKAAVWRFIKWLIVWLIIFAIARFIFIAVTQSG